MNTEPNQCSTTGTHDSPYERLLGYEVQDSAGIKVGHVNHVYVEEVGHPLFIGVKTGWLFGKDHVVPVSSAEVNDAREIVRLPFTEEQIKNAPSFAETAEISNSDQASLLSYYGVTSPTGVISQSENPLVPATENVAENRTIKLKEEELKVGKRQVEAGGVRLRKIVRTETVNQPVELQREEIVIGRVPSRVAAGADESFTEEDIFIPLRQEEAVVEKTARVREEVRVGKKTEIDRQQVGGQIRKESLEVDKKDPRASRT